MIYSTLSQASRKAFLFPANARQSVYASGACDKELETNRLAGFCVEAEMKRCTKCRELQDISQFKKDTRRTDGVGSWCRKCRNEGERKRRASIPDRMRELYRRWTAAKKARGYKEKRSAARKEKNREGSHKRFIANPEKAHEASRKWYAAHKDAVRDKSRARRARKKGVGGTFTEKEWQALKEFYGNACLRCGRREPEVELERDHVIPLILGGPNVVGNIQPLCVSCNRSKHARHIDYRLVIFSP
jgi:5-methylcytosine-specific restriction endonuclease McrA